MGMYYTRLYSQNAGAEKDRLVIRLPYYLMSYKVGHLGGDNILSNYIFIKVSGMLKILRIYFSIGFYMDI